MSKHTSVPWKLFFRNCIIEVECEGHPPIVGWTGFDDSDRTVEEHHANAEFIVRAVNAHDDLLSACKAAMRILSLWGPQEVPVDSDHYEENKALAMMQNAFELAILKAERG